MNLSDKHKAVLITLLLSGTVLLFVFNLSLNTGEEIASESYYEIIPEKELTPEEAKILEALEKINASKAETNSAFNSTDKSKQYAQAYEQIAPPEDYVPSTSEESDGADDGSNSISDKKPLKPAVNKEQLSSFSKVNELIKNQKDAGVNTKSTISFSLTDRKKVHIPIPVYLCEVDGKIVINITVNSKGEVIDTYLNSSSTSSNQCLIETAMQYAKDSRFSADASKKEQLGSITFSFIGKH